MTEERKPKQNLTARAKARLCALWESGNYTLQQLAEEFGISERHAARLVSQNNAKKGALNERVRQKVEQQVEQQVATDAATIARRVHQTKEQHYAYSAFIAKKTVEIIHTAVEGNRPLAGIAGDMKALQLASQTLKTCREERFIALGYDPDNTDDDNELPELVIHELTQEDIEEMQRRQLMGDDALEPIEDLPGEDDRVETGDDEDDRVEVD